MSHPFNLGLLCFRNILHSDGFLQVSNPPFPLIFSGVVNHVFPLQFYHATFSPRLDSDNFNIYSFAYFYHKAFKRLTILMCVGINLVALVNNIVLHSNNFLSTFYHLLSFGNAYVLIMRFTTNSRQQQTCFLFFKIWSLFIRFLSIHKISFNHSRIAGCCYLTKS